MQLIKLVYIFALLKRKVLDISKALVPWLGKTSRMFGFLLHEVMVDHDIDITKEQLIILIKLNEKGSLKQRELAFITDRDKTSLTRLINTMERKNLVERRISAEDKRVNIVHITEAGYSLLESATPILHNTVQKAQQGISSSELNDAVTTIKKLQNNISTLSKHCGAN